MDGFLPAPHPEVEASLPVHREHAPSAASRGKVATIAQSRGARGDASARPDLLRHPGRPVSEIMSKKLVTFTAETSMEEATQVLLARHISGAPVVDAAGKPIGIVSKTDLLEAWHEHVKDAGVPQPGCDLPATGVVVGDIMVPYLLAAQDTSPISLAAALMAYEGVHRLLVLDETNAMVGIVSSLDVLRWLAQLSGFCMERSDAACRPVPTG